MAEKACTICPVRVATTADETGVSTLLDACYPILFAHWYDKTLPGQALPVMTKANPQLLQSGRFYVAETAGGQSIGCGGWSVQDPRSGETIGEEAHIRHFATHPEWTRRGIASTIIACCFNDATAQGVQRMSCYAALGSERFYQASGFDAIQPIDLAMPGGIAFPAVMMHCELKSV